jgi:hypothetical protein
VLETGKTFLLKVPDSALDGRAATATAPAYGTSIVFSMACAGHIEYLGQSPAASPEAIPFGCFDTAHRRLGSDDFVFAFSRIFVFEDRSNANPVIDHLTFDGAPVDLGAGITVDHCAATDVKSCPVTSLDILVPSSSQEPDPSARGLDGVIDKEELWVSYYLTAGSVKRDLQMLYDPVKGRPESTVDDFTAPLAPTEGALFAVVHDNRGGVAWVRVPLHVR